MPIPLGILAAAGVRPAAGGSYELIESYSVGSGGLASVTFSNLNTYNTTYQHLQIRAVLRNDNANDFSEMFLRFNGDSGSNYRTHVLGGTGSTAYSGDIGVQTQMRTEGAGVGNSAASGIFGVTVIDILDAYESKNKTVRMLSGRETATGERRITLTSGLWMNTDSLTTILLDQSFGSNFMQGSRFSIYGLKAS